MLPKLHPERRALLEAFAAGIPQSLPEHAYASAEFLEPASPATEGPLIVKRSNGYADVQLGIANPGSRTNQPNVLCLRNGIQVGCTPEVDAWEVTLPPTTLAFVPTHIPAESGDQLTFLFVAENEQERVMLGSRMSWAYVEKRPDPPSTFVNAPAHQKVLGGCDIAPLIKDLSDTRTSPVDLFRFSATQRGTVYLLIQLCNPTGREYVRLIPVVDRASIADLPGELWHSPVHLTSEASVIPVDTTLLNSAHEFQVAIVPLTQEAASALHQSQFTQAVVFSN